ncbi:MAG TPA: acyl-CoA thioesterase [Bacteroidetes bacterium]|nr:acyl-CoA thioesterase [Bacteroidota bacterium]
MYSFKYKFRVRYAETDQMGYAYYGNYAKYYEIGRVETIRSLGFAYKDFETVWGIMLPVVNMQARYIKPAFYDDLLTVETQIREMPGKMVTFYCNIYNEQDEMINRGEVKLFFIDMKTGKRVSAPDILTKKLKPYFE